MDEIIQNQEVKSKNGNQKIHKVEIFEAQAFFKKVAQLNIKKSADVCENLCELLCIDKKYPNLLMYQKLKKCIADFKTNSYFGLVGSNKNKINLEAYQEQILEEE